MLTGSWDKQPAPEGRGAVGPAAVEMPGACRKPRAPGLHVPARAKAALSSLQRCKVWRAAGGPRRWQWQLRPGVPGVQASPGVRNQEAGVKRAQGGRVRATAFTEGQCCWLRKLGPAVTHPLVFIHPFKGVLGQWVLSVSQLRHHSIKQL